MTAYDDFWIKVLEQEEWENELANYVSVKHEEPTDSQRNLLLGDDHETF